MVSNLYGTRANSKKCLQTTISSIRGIHKVPPPTCSPFTIMGRPAEMSYWVGSIARHLCWCPWDGEGTWGAKCLPCPYLPLRGEWQRHLATKQAETILQSWSVLWSQAGHMWSVGRTFLITVLDSFIPKLHTYKVCKLVYLGQYCLLRCKQLSRVLDHGLSHYLLHTNILAGEAEIEPGSLCEQVCMLPQNYSPSIGFIWLTTFKPVLDMPTFYI